MQGLSEWLVDGIDAGHTMQLHQLKGDQAVWFGAVNWSVDGTDRTVSAYPGNLNSPDGIKKRQ